MSFKYTIFRNLDRIYQFSINKIANILYVLLDTEIEHNIIVSPQTLCI
jgi:hypothetical protein